MKRKLNKYEQLFDGMFPPSEIPYLKTLYKPEAYIYATKVGYHWYSGRWISVLHFGKDGTINNKKYGRYPAFQHLF